MQYDECLLEVQKVAGRELTPSEKKTVSRKVVNMIKKLDLVEAGSSRQEQLLKMLDGETKEMTLAAKIEKRNAIKNQHARIKLEHKLMKWANDINDPAEGFEAWLDNSLSAMEGSKNGLTRKVSSAKHAYVQGLLSRLAKKDLIKIASSKDESIQKQIWKAMTELNNDKPDADALNKLLPEAVETAKIFNEMNDFSRVEANKAGAWIKKLPGYVMKRSHDAVKIAKAAGDTIPHGDPRHFEAWSEFIHENIDWEKSFADVEPGEELQDMLKTMFTQLSNGYHVKFGNAPVPGMKGGANVAKGMSHERVLHFKNADAEFDYHKRFGHGSNLLENMSSGLQKMARDTAIMNHAGPNAQVNIDTAVGNIVKKLTKEGKGTEATALQKRHENLMKTVWPNITGESAMPGNSDWARVSAVSRNMMMIADLANAIFASLTDPLAVGSTFRYSGERSGASFFKGMTGIAKEVISSVGKAKDEVDMHIAAEAGIGIEAIGDSLGILDPDLDTPGRAAAAVNQMFKINGMSWWQDTFRLGSVKMTGTRHAQYAGKAFDALPEGMRSVFKQFEINSKEWDLIRSTELFEDPRNKTKYLFAENVKSIPDEKIAEHLGGKPSKTKIDNYRQELHGKYRNIFSEIASLATTEPGAGIRGMLLRGTRPGTPEGELLRHFMMYKTFTASFMQNHLGRELHGYRDNKLSSAAAIAEMFKDPKGGSMAGMANLMVWAPILGYVSMSAKEMAKGKEPRYPDNAEEAQKIFLASMARSGAMGLYGDFLFGEVSQKYGADFVLSLAGPTVRRAVDVGNLYGTYRQGGDTGAEAFRLLLNNTPGYNLFYTKWALDYMFVYRLQEAMNPGYLKRMERKAKKDKDQEYLIPPSSLIPRGGGF